MSKLLIDERKAVRLYWLTISLLISAFCFLNAVFAHFMSQDFFLSHMTAVFALSLVGCVGGAAIACWGNGRVRFAGNSISVLAATFFFDSVLTSIYGNLFLERMNIHMILVLSGVTFFGFLRFKVFTNNTVLFLVLFACHFLCSIGLNFFYGPVRISAHLPIGVLYALIFFNFHCGLKDDEKTLIGGFRRAGMFFVIPAMVEGARK